MRQHPETVKMGFSFPEGNWTHIEADASTRRYFRGRWKSRDALLADFGEDLDGLERFVHVGKVFSSAGLRVPEIFQTNPDKNELILEWIKGPRLSSLRWKDSFEDTLLRTAEKIAAIDEWGDGPDMLALDEPRLRFELDFFLLHFVERFMNEEISPETRVGTAQLAERLATFPAALAHRDFHSDNILLEDGETMVLLDFQDALTAPRCYDAASLLADCYRFQHPAIERRIKRKWRELTGIPEEEFNLTLLQRSLKALGTFGYQLTARKMVRYLAYIPSTARKALELLDTSPGLGELKSVLEIATRL